MLEYGDLPFLAKEVAVLILEIALCQNSETSGKK
jgi:hypothetical protein